MLNLILFGPPGSGKGTQATRLKEKFSLEHISTGDLLRSELAAGTPLGMEAKKFMDQGALVPDEVVIGMIKNKLESSEGKIKGVIYDGFPRTVPQAVALDSMLDEKGTCIAQVLSLEVEEDELVRRIVERGKTSGRADDNAETVRKRYKVYLSDTSKVEDHYKEFDIVKRVKGEGEIDDITAALSTEIEALI